MSIKGAFMVVLTIAILLMSVVGGLYVSLVWALYGGIILIINGVQANPMVAPDIAWGIVRVLFFGIVGWATFFVGAFLSGMVAMTCSRLTRRRHG